MIRKWLPDFIIGEFAVTMSERRNRIKFHDPSIIRLLTLSLPMSQLSDI
jgi:hypothetical protein